MSNISQIALTRLLDWISTIISVYFFLDPFDHYDAFWFPLRPCFPSSDYPRGGVVDRLPAGGPVVGEHVVRGERPTHGQPVPGVASL